MKRPPHIALPDGPPSSAAWEGLRCEGPMLLEVPEGWCYRIHRPAPPGGWKRATREALRPGLFPEPLERLWWEETIHPDGSWEIWALPEIRIREALGPSASAIFTTGRALRVFPTGLVGRGSLSEYPNLAPLGQRPLRIPWRLLSRWMRWGLPVSVAILGGLVASVVFRTRWARLEVEHARLQQTVQGLESSVGRERGNLALLRRVQAPGGTLPRWAKDLDALTRLLPEDTRLAGLKWESEELQIDLLAPQPERIREILEAAPEFGQVHFVGNLDRRGEKSRLVLVLRPKEAR